jgi:hypothetical protein
VVAVVSGRGDLGRGFGGELLLCVVLGQGSQVVGNGRLGAEFIEGGLHNLSDMIGRRVGELVVEMVDNGVEVPAGVVEDGRSILIDVAF